MCGFYEEYDMNLKLVFESGDVVLISVFLILITMSVLTWTITIVRTIKLQISKKNLSDVQEQITNANTLSQATKIAQNHECLVSDLWLAGLDAMTLYQNHKNSEVIQGMPFNQYFMGQMQHHITQALRQFERGLTILATVGSTAPFIGLFGTVWGIYHALINISVSGQMSIAAVSGPIGEALVATAAGLFVAIPSVLAYNFLVRGNKKLVQDMHAFANDAQVQILSHQGE